jgi:Cytochrome c554 and c-prime
MKKIKLLYLLFGLSAMSFIFLNAVPELSQSEYKYVGVNTCVGACHKSEAQGNQLAIWQTTLHSKAFQNLQTPRADSIAESRGFTTAAAETPQCVKCHVLGKDIEEGELESTFDKTQGVQCESCHGPGSDYKKLSIMKDKDKAMANGLIIHTEKEAFCTHCHNSESPTFVSFDYDTMWDKIKHPVPAKE